MSKLLMISGDRNLAAGKRGAFYNTLEEFHKHWDRIDIICPQVIHRKGLTFSVDDFKNVFIHPSPWSLWKQSWWIYQKGQETYCKQRFDLITVHEYPPFYNGMGARMLWSKIKVPYVLEIHHIPGYPRAAGWKEIIYRNLVKMLIKYDTSKAAAVRTVSQNQVPDFLKRWGVPPEKIKFIPSLYIDLEVFRPLNLEKKYDLMFLGRLAENKGINLFLEAVKRTGVKAIIVGDGPLAQEVKSKIKKWKLEIELYGWAKDSQEVAELINQSKILMMPSYNEGGPRVVVEAMACGVPVLATPVGIVPDIVKEGESGVIIDWRAADIAKKALDLLNDPDKLRRYGQAGLEISKRFEKESMIKNYVEQLKVFVK